MQANQCNPVMARWYASAANRRGPAMTALWRTTVLALIILGGDWVADCAQGREARAHSYWRTSSGASWAGGKGNRERKQWQKRLIQSGTVRRNIIVRSGAICPTRLSRISC